jgi:hypothetical protein
MNDLSLIALLAAEHRADLLRQAERYRRAHDVKVGSRQPPKQAKLLWLATFRRNTARPVAVSRSTVLGVAETRTHQGLRLLGRGMERVKETGSSRTVHLPPSP